MGIDVLRYIDVVVGFSVIMVIASALVTAITQAAVRFCNLRGRNLRNGVVQLITQIEPDLREYAQPIAESVLKHPLVAEPESLFGPLLRRVRDWWRGWGLGQRLGPVIQREEFIRVLVLLAERGLPPEAFAPQNGKTREQVAADVQKMLTQAIGADPKMLLQGIRERSLELERNAPWLATHVRQTQAIIDAAANDVVGTATQFVARVNAWFDNSMERVSQSFAQHARLVTIVGAALVALGLPLDSIDLLRRLSVDDNFRNALVARGEKLVEEQEKQPAVPQDKATAAAQDYSLRVERENIEQKLAALQNPQLAIAPDEWWVERYYSTACLKDGSQLTPPAEGNLSFVVAGKPLIVNGTTMEAVRDAINQSGAPVRATIKRCVIGWPPSRTEGLRLIVLAQAKHAIPSVALQAETNASDESLLQQGWRFRRGAFAEAATRPGILLSVVLLSFGAPFWFEMLKSSLQLRPLLAGKEEGERDERKSQQEPPVAAVASVPAPSTPVAPPSAAVTPPPAAAAPVHSPDVPESEAGDLLAVDAQG